MRAWQPQQRLARALAQRPAAEQAAAIADRERDLFLAAGAGTGKTSVLVERFCAAVAAEEGAAAAAGMEQRAGVHVHRAGGR